MQQNSSQVCIQSGCEQTCFVHFDSNIETGIHTHQGHKIIPFSQVLLLAKKYTSNKLVTQEINHFVQQVQKLKNSLDSIIQLYIEKVSNSHYQNYLENEIGEILEKILDKDRNKELTADELFDFMKFTSTNSIIDELVLQTDRKLLKQLVQNVQISFKKYSQKNYQFAFKCFLKGWQYFQNKKPLQAIECYTRAISLSPHADFYFRRGFVYHSQNKLDLAQADYSAALRINQSHSNTLINIGLIRSVKGNTSEALQYYSRAIQSNPDDSISYNNRGYILYKLSKYRQALSDITKSIALQKTKQSYELRSQIYLKLGRKSEAQKDYQISKRM